MLRPKKHLGQHFLINDEICEKIVSAISQKENVVEIGPGEGALTELFSEHSFRNVKLLEKDAEAAMLLRDRFPNYAIDEGDVLKMDWDFFGRAYSIIGNLPYNISSPILFKVLEHRDLVQETVFMTQLEVGNRILGPSGNKQYGILSILIQLFYHGTKVVQVGPGNFRPPPKVDSLVFRLERNKFILADEEFVHLKKIVKASFSQRRKKLKNSLSSFYQELDFVPEEFMSKRAEELTPDDFLCMAKNYCSRA